MEELEKSGFSLKNFLSGSIRRKIIFGFLIILFIPLSILSYINFNISSDALLDSTLDNVEGNLDHIFEEFYFRINIFKEDVLFLSETPPIQGIIRVKDNKGIDPLDGSTDKLWRERLGIIFAEKAKVSGNYIQIRYLDEKGNELVRVDSDFGGENIEIISEDKLQNKADRYYFYETMNLEKNEIFISLLDLNREGDLTEIEVPHKPVIRFGTPVFDEKDNKRGILIINVFGESILNLLEEKDSRSNRFLVDKNGFYLFNENKSKTFGSSRDLNTGENIKKDIPPSMADLALSKNSKTIYMKNHKHVFGVVPFFLDKNNKEEFWAILEIIPETVILGSIFYLKNLNIFIGGIFIFFIIIFGGYISNSILKPFNKLFYVTNQLRLGNFNERANIKTGDELETLGDSFNKTSEALGKIDKEHKQLEKSKTEFLSITSHELRSPMTPMRAQLQMLKEEYFGKLTEKQKNSINIVLRNTERLDNIIVDLLEISRIEAARLKFRFVKQDFSICINSLIKEMDGFMPDKKIKIITKFKNLPIIEHDPDRFCQVLRNLVNNAKKFSPKNSIIEIGGKLQEGEILFYIKDQGAGISLNDQKRIFDPFFQAEQTIYREHSGTGLGLSIVRGIIESQNGKVWLESEVGKGTIFFFTVPLKPVKEIKPIKLLFSSSKNIEKQIREMFINILGPMGEGEFNRLIIKNEINDKDLINYIDLLTKKGILQQEIGMKFKNNISNIFGKKISSKIN